MGKAIDAKMIARQADWKMFDAKPIGDRMIAELLKHDLKYTYKKASMTYGDPTKQEFDEYRARFRVVFKHLVAKGCRFIWIDETSFNATRTRPYTWGPVKNPPAVVNFKPSYSTAISALLDMGMHFSKMRVGTNTADTFLEFLGELETNLRLLFAGVDEHGKDRYLQYRSRLVVIMDNATIHTNFKIQEFFTNRKIMCLTLPQYTPQFNPIELMF
jgi:hypothetical protein